MNIFGMFDLFMFHTDFYKSACSCGKKKILLLVDNVKASLPPCLYILKLDLLFCEGMHYSNQYC